MDTKVITPYDIDSMSIEDIKPLITSGIEGLPGPKSRLNVTQVIYKVLGFDLSSDYALALASTPKQQLIMAGAGGGKTTSSQIKIALMKFFMGLKEGKRINGNNFLCLVFNDHNVQPMEAAHKRIISRIKNSGVTGFDVDDQIESTTLHAFCNKWRREYSTWLGHDNFELLKDGIEVFELRRAFASVAKRFKIPEEQNFAALHKMYVLTHQSLKEYGDEDLLDMFPEIELSPEIVKAAFKMYDAWKKTRKLYEFIDMLTAVRRLFLENESARKRVQTYYRYIVADEVQDFTPLMIDLLRLIAGETTPILMIGDEDQAIYDFNGVDPQQILKFNELFPNGEVFILNTNRRCGRNIVDAASFIISENKTRFAKKLLAIHDGGDIELIPYMSEEGQILSIVKALENMDSEKRSKVAISYRNTILSGLLAEALEEKGIVFNVLSGIKPFEHELYGRIIKILDMLYRPYDSYSKLYLYQVLPSITRKEVADVLGYNTTTRQFEGKLSEERIHLKDIDFGKYENYSKFVDEFSKLVQFSYAINDQPMNKWFPYLFEMFCKYYWDYRIKNEEGTLNAEIHKAFTRRVFNFFNVNKLYIDVVNDMNNRKTLFARQDSLKLGVTLGTFHSLKGLEFDENWMIYMDDSIFPSISFSAKNHDVKALSKQTEAETRLCYVAMTRPRKILKVYYYSANPSYYVKRLMRYTGEIKKHFVSSVEVEPVKKLEVLIDPTKISASDKSTESNGSLDSLFRKF